MENTIDYSKAPKKIQDKINYRDMLGEITIGDIAEDNKIGAIYKNLDKEIKAWEATQENA